LQRDDRKLSLFLTHRGALVDYAAPIVGCRSRAEDVVQEAFLRFAPEKPAPVKPDAPGRVIDHPIAYLYRMVRNLALNGRRRESGEQRSHDDERTHWMAPATPRTPEQEAIHAQEVAHVAAALADLPENARIAVEMHRFGGCTLQEVADHLGVSVPTAHRLVRDALVKIALRLGASAT
jgi:RNA polymerase sigma factor (sigma-70 family)